MATTLFLSGGASNSAAGQSLGGAKSSVQVPFELMAAMPSQYTAGRTIYRCVYVTSSDARQAMKAWIVSDTPAASTTIAIGWGTSAAGGTEQTIVSETTAPSGVTFSSPTSEATGISGGDLTANQSRALWIRAQINAGSSAIAESFTIGLNGTAVASNPSATTSADFNTFMNAHFPARPYQLGSSVAERAIGSSGVRQMDALTNIAVGLNGNRQGAIRFRAKYSGNLTAMRLLWAQAAGSPGYSAGNGGTIRIRVFPDNGSGLPNTGGTVFSQLTFSPGLVDGGWSTGDNVNHTFTANAPLVAGTIYHMVFDNTHASASSNYISIDGAKCYLENGYSPIYEDDDWLFLRKDGAAAWMPMDPANIDTEWVSPNVQLTQGANPSYGSILVGTGNAVSPNRALTRTNTEPWRTRIIPATTRTWYGGAVNLNFLVAGTVNWTLKTSEGTTLASGSFSRGSANAGTTVGTDPFAYVYPDWIPFYFGTGVQLTAGQTYYMEYVPQGSCQIRISCTQDGRGYGYADNVAMIETAAQHWNSGAYIFSYPYDHTDNTLSSSWREFFAAY